MGLFEVTSFMIILALLCECFYLSHKNKVLKQENIRLLNEYGGYNDMKEEARQFMRASTKIKTVKMLREKYGLSMLDAKDIADSVEDA